MRNLESLEMTIECPTCRRKVTKTVGWFKRANQTCPHGCGTTFNTEGQFRSGLDNAQRDLDKLKRQLSSLKF